jgi:hypothetical protein
MAPNHLFSARARHASVSSGPVEDNVWAGATWLESWVLEPVAIDTHKVLRPALARPRVTSNPLSAECHGDPDSQRPEPTPREDPTPSK